MHLQRLDRRNEHNGIGFQPGLPALDVEELLRAEIGTESCLGDHVVAQLQRCSSCHDGVATMSDVGERATVHQGRVVFHRLHEIGLHRVAQ